MKWCYITVKLEADNYQLNRQ